LELPETLSSAERSVAQELVRGKNNGQIAAARGTSVRTVANQVHAILRKTGAGSRAEIVARLRARPATP
jgi:DNA-binding NarL/FixJ family response regulator